MLEIVVNQQTAGRSYQYALTSGDAGLLYGVASALTPIASSVTTANSTLGIQWIRKSITVSELPTTAKYITFVAKASVASGCFIQSAILWLEIPMQSTQRLDELTDVDTTGITDGQVLKWDQATDMWIPVTKGSGTGDMTKAAYDTGTTGYKVDYALNLASGTAGETTSAAQLANARIASPGYVFDNGTTDVAVDDSHVLYFPYSCTIQGCTVLLTDGGTATDTLRVDVQKTSYTNFPASFTSITASDTPVVVPSASKGTTTASTWTTAISAGDVIRFRVLDACAALKRFVIQLKVLK